MHEQSYSDDISKAHKFSMNHNLLD